jgi:hypothetical protein
MVGVAVDHTSPFDRRSSVLLDTGHHVFRGSLEIHACILGRQDYFKDALVLGLLPALGQRTE